MEPASVRLTNADFRKLIATPRHSSKSSNLLSGTNVSEFTNSLQNDETTGIAGASGAAGGAAAAGVSDIKKKLASSERNDLRRKKKNFYAALKKQEDGKLQELSEKYRDRARERRDNINTTDYQVINTPGHHNTSNATANVNHNHNHSNNNNNNINNNNNNNANNNNNSTSGYRAVAPDIKSVSDAAERRRRIIQESKFLGGDMEHTHLVKGLDYALLQKVRSELENKEYEEQEAAEANEKKIAEKKLAELAAAAAVVAAEAEQHNDINKNDKNHSHMDENYMKSIKSTMARNIYNLVQMRRSKDIQRNELFAPGRMAYIIDLSTDNANNDNNNIYETDIPTTLIRSKYEVPVNRDDIATLTTNDIVINKLAQILTYLRAGGRNKRNKKRDKDKPLFYDKETTTNATTATSNIIITGGQQQLINNNNDNKKSLNTNNLNIYDDIGEYDANKRISKLTKQSSMTGTKSTYFIDNNRNKKQNDNNYDDDDDDDDELAPPPPKITKTISRLALMQNNNEPEGYAECYPGLDEMNDAIDDSDDEVDYTKMDLGNKKGPIGRWDFDTQEEYSDYMSTKEALPKAAFQYGVKMQDGRKTRKNKIERNEKAELDREWQKIQNIIQKRKIPNNSRKTASNDD